MIYPDDLADWEAGVSKIQKIGDIHESEHRMIGFDDKVRWIRSRSELIESATGAPFLLGTCTDVTELRESMIELLAAKEEADQANQAKSEFLSLMNHELRTPLNTIIAPCELALGQAQDELSRKMLEMAVTSGRHLLDLINRVLDLSKIEAGRFEEEKESIELSKFLQEFLKPFESLAEKENCSLESVVDPSIGSVDLDPAVIRQMLFNLIGNAIKYAPGKPIKVEVSPVDDGLLFEVIDEGAGISQKEQQRVFEGFSRGEGSESKTKEGVGLGLRICKKLAEAAGGRLDLESKVGEGSVFRFFLPLHHETVPEDAASPREISSQDAIPDLDADGSRVLIVEDVISNRLFLEAFCLSRKIPFDSCEDGESALGKFKPGRHRVVLMDLGLPGMRGEETSRRIRTKAADKGVYIIAQTGFAGDSYRSKLVEARIDDLLTKPITLTGLSESMQKAFATLRDRVDVRPG